MEVMEMTVFEKKHLRMNLLMMKMLKNCNFFSTKNSSLRIIFFRLDWKNQKLLNFQTKHFSLTYGSFIEEYNK